MANPQRVITNFNTFEHLQLELREIFLLFLRKGFNHKEGRKEGRKKNQIYAIVRLAILTNMLKHGFLNKFNFTFKHFV